MVTILTPGLYQPKLPKNITQHDQYLLENKGVCSAILADALNITERFVIGRQRKLGLRKLSGNQPLGTGYGKLKGVRNATAS